MPDLVSSLQPGFGFTDAFEEVGDFDAGAAAERAFAKIQPEAASSIRVWLRRAGGLEVARSGRFGAGWRWLVPLTLGRNHSPGSGALAGSFCPQRRHSPLTDPCWICARLIPCCEQKFLRDHPSSRMNGSGSLSPSKHSGARETEIKCVSGDDGSVSRFGCGS
jgi:hypothetical protein